jgi:arginine utilization protein RocB
MISDDIAHTASLHAPCQLHVARQRVFDFDKLLETVMKLNECTCCNAIYIDEGGEQHARVVTTHAQMETIVAQLLEEVNLLRKEAASARAEAASARAEAAAREATRDATLREEAALARAEAAARDATLREELAAARAEAAAARAEAAARTRRCARLSGARSRRRCRHLTRPSVTARSPRSPPASAFFPPPFRPRTRPTPRARLS